MYAKRIRGTYSDRLYSLRSFWRSCDRNRLCQLCRQLITFGSFVKIENELTRKDIPNSISIYQVNNINIRSARFLEKAFKLVGECLLRWGFFCFFVAPPNGPDKAALACYLYYYNTSHALQKSNRVTHSPRFQAEHRDRPRPACILAWNRITR